MTRSRVVLMVAWGLLAAGSIVQFVRAGGDDDGADRAIDDPPASLADVGAEDDSDGADDTADAATDDTDAADGPGEAEADEAAQVSTVATAGPSLVATVVGDGVASRAAPGSGVPTHWFPSPTQFGGERTFLVVDDTSDDEWVKVSLPVMPNGQEGWIPRSAVELTTIVHRAEVDLSDATVTVWEGDEVVVTTRAVIGRRSTPTPLGRFYVRDLISQPDPDGEFGPWLLALSGFSETLDTFEGGLPALALHGTDEPERIGSALSSGCLRIPNELITALAETVPLGTPITIVA